jgi:hypothetical protein
MAQRRRSKEPPATVTKKTGRGTGSFSDDHFRLMIEAIFV